MWHRTKTWYWPAVWLPVLLLAAWAGAQALDVPNPSFEEGGDNPAGWRLSGGAGAWLMEAAEGVRAVSVTGDGRPGTSNYWYSADLPLEPFTTYELRFQARRVDGGSGGCAISGPVFCNRDLGGLTREWQPYSSIFVTPNEMRTGQHWIRFGQWEMNGTVAYDDISVVRVAPVHRRINGLTLGEGERVSRNRYEFTAPLQSACANYARPLAYIGCFFNTNRLIFGVDSMLVYCHEISGFSQTEATVEVNLGHYVSGELAVEAGADGETWRELGVMHGVSTETFALPAEMLPARAVWVRFRSQSESRPGHPSKPGSFQIHGYTCRATLDGDAGQSQGATRFVAVSQTDPNLEIEIVGLGDAEPGGRNALVARITPMEALRALHPTVTVSSLDHTIETIHTVHRTDADRVEVPYELTATGPNRLVFTLGDGSPYRAETTLEVSVIHDSSYGELLPDSGEDAGLWWCASGWKVSRTRPLPKNAGRAMRIQAARNETEAAQAVIRPARSMRGFLPTAGDLIGPGGSVIPAERIEVLRVRYVPVTRPTDYVGTVGLWPDPLPPFAGPIDLEADHNQPIWVRVHVPRDAAAGRHAGAIRLRAEGYAAEVPLEVEVFDFTLPDRKQCTTAFGFSAPLAFRYHGVTEEDERRAVYRSYLQALSAHHISPYDPAALDPFQVSWPTPGDSGPLRPEQLVPRIDWAAWDAAMTEAMDRFHFNSFRIPIVGLGGGTFHSRTEPTLLGYSEDTPEYQAAFANYCRAVQDHLREKGWLDYAYVYWFDEPDPKDYEFVMNGFRKLKEAAPDIPRMLTEQVEPELIGGPNIWCPITPEFDMAAAEERRKAGDKFWWYVCTGPKAPYVTLFIDHPGTEMRVWLWQTWQRRIDGILIWETNYWTSSAAYPDPDHPQNPYEDPMGWTSGYDTPSGARIPWGNGDGRFLYPPEAAADGNPPRPVLDPPVGSIRLDMLRDGIEDYEYLAMLARLIEQHAGKMMPEDRARFEALLDVPEEITADLTRFTIDPEPITRRREQIARAIEQLLGNRPIFPEFFRASPDRNYPPCSPMGSSGSRWSCRTGSHAAIRKG